MLGTEFRVLRKQYILTTEVCLQPLNTSIAKLTGILLSKYRQYTDHFLIRCNGGRVTLPTRGVFTGDTKSQEQKGLLFGAVSIATL